MNKDETSIVTLNSTATIVWNLIDKHHDFDAIAPEMKSIFADVDEQKSSLTWTKPFLICKYRNSCYR